MSRIRLTPAMRAYLDGLPDTHVRLLVATNAGTGETKAVVVERTAGQEAEAQALSDQELTNQEES